MNKTLITSLSALLLVSLLTVDANAATRKRSTARAPVDTYFYGGTSLYDLAAPHFGSPVRGYQLFEAIANRGN